MVRETSIEAYRSVQECGWIGEKQREIYETLYKSGPSTSAEVFATILKHQRGRNVLTQTRARFTELREMGAIQEVERRACSITGRKAIVWDVTAKIPTEIKKKPKRIFYVVLNEQGNPLNVYREKQTAERIAVIQGDQVIKVKEVS